MLEPARARACDHPVMFHRGAGELVPELVSLAKPALARGAAVAIVARAETHGAIRLGLAAAGVDAVADELRGRLELVDAAATLARFDRGDHLDREAFAATIVPLLDRLAAGGREVVIYGEIVDLLAAAGRHADALALEGFWAELLATRSLTLVCGYALASFPELDHEADLVHVCAAHTEVRPAAAADRPTGDYALELTRLQQRVLALGRELDRATAREATLGVERAAMQGVVRQAAQLDLIGRISAGVAHDLNNMLAVVRIGCERVVRELGADHEMAEMGRDVHTALEHATSLISPLLAAGRREPALPRPIVLDELCAELERLIRSAVGREIELVIVPPARPVIALAERGSLIQVVLNLAINARDAMPAGGQLTLATAVVERAAPGPDATIRRWAVLRVVDTGCGMDEATRARIFDPFFSTKPIAAGGGLGLPLVKTLVDQAGGFVEVTSEPSSGASFAVHLPLASG